MTLSMRIDTLCPSELVKLRDLMNGSARPTSAALSSIIMEDEDESVFHYDIREVDSLVAPSASTLSIFSADPVVVKPPVLDHASPKQGSILKSFCTQTVVSDDSEQLEEFRDRLLPNLEAEITLYTSRLVDSDSKLSRLETRLQNSILFTPVTLSLPAAQCSWITVDSRSIDFFQSPDSDFPEVSVPIESAKAKIVATSQELHLFHSNTLKARISSQPDQTKFNLVLFALKSVGVAISLSEVPTNTLKPGLVDSQSPNPRRIARVVIPFLCFTPLSTPLGRMIERAEELLRDFRRISRSDQRQLYSWMFRRVMILALSQKLKSVCNLILSYVDAMGDEVNLDEDGFNEILHNCGYNERIAVNEWISSRLPANGFESMTLSQLVDYVKTDFTDESSVDLCPSAEFVKVMSSTVPFNL